MKPEIEAYQEIVHNLILKEVSNFKLENPQKNNTTNNNCFDGKFDDFSCDVLEMFSSFYGIDSLEQKLAAVIEYITFYTSNPVKGHRQLTAYSQLRRFLKSLEKSYQTEDTTNKFLLIEFQETSLKLIEFLRFKISETFFCIDFDLKIEENYQPEKTVACLAGLLILFIDVVSCTLVGLLESKNEGENENFTSDVSGLIYYAIVESCENLKKSAREQSDDNVDFLLNILSKLNFSKNYLEPVFKSISGIELSKLYQENLNFSNENMFIDPKTGEDIVEDKKQTLEIYLNLKQLEKVHKISVDYKMIGIDRNMINQWITDFFLELEGMRLRMTGASSEVVIFGKRVMKFSEILENFQEKELVFREFEKLVDTFVNDNFSAQFSGSEKSLGFSEFVDAVYQLYEVENVVKDVEIKVLGDFDDVLPCKTRKYENCKNLLKNKNKEILSDDLIEHLTEFLKSSLTENHPETKFMQYLETKVNLLYEKFSKTSNPVIFAGFIELLSHVFEIILTCFENQIFNKHLIRIQFDHISELLTILGGFLYADGEGIEVNSFEKFRVIKKRVSVGKSSSEVLISAFLKGKCLKQISSPISNSLKAEKGMLKLEIEDLNGEIVLKLVKAKGLPKMDVIGDTDAYVKMKLLPVHVFGAGKMLKSNTVDDTSDPVWNEVFKLSYKRGSSLEKPESCLHLSVFDSDLLDRDDYIGQV